MVFEKVRAILAENLDIDEDIITMDTDVIKDLDADSLDVVEMVMDLEDQLGISIADESIRDLRTVGDVVRFVEALL